MKSANPAREVQVIRRRLKALEEQLQQAGSAPANRIAHHLTAVITELEGDLARQDAAAVSQAAAPAPACADPPAPAGGAHPVAPEPPRASSPQRRRRFSRVLGLAVLAVVAGVLWFPAVGNHEDRPAVPVSAAGLPQARPSDAAWPADALGALRRLNIQFNGRAASMEDFSRQRLSFISGAQRLGSHDSVQTVFSMIAEPQRWREAPVILVESPGVRAMLGVERGTLRASWGQLMARNRLPRRVLAVARMQAHRRPLTGDERELLVVSARAMQLEDLFNQHLHLVSPAAGGAQIWTPILDPDDYPVEQQIGVKRSWSALLAAMRDGDPGTITGASRRLRVLLHNLSQPLAPAYRPPQLLVAMRD